MYSHSCILESDFQNEISRLRSDIIRYGDDNYNSRYDFLLSDSLLSRSYKILDFVDEYMVFKDDYEYDLISLNNELRNMEDKLDEFEAVADKFDDILFDMEKAKISINSGKMKKADIIELFNDICDEYLGVRR